jgi:MFS family permease
VTLLCLAQIVSTVDRGMLALVVDPVRAELGISEVQIALLQGFAFSVFYIITGVVLGIVADAVNRKRLLVAGIVVWSAATIASGLAHDFTQMFTARLFIGIGEAVLAPCAVTIISDMFPAEHRGRPMALYVFGSIVAYGVGSLIIGYVLAAAPRGDLDWISFLRGLTPWRIAFVLAGLFGVVLSALISLLREPPRQVSVAGDRLAKDLRGSLKYMAQNWPMYLSFYGTLTFFGMGMSVASNWGPMLLTRVYGYSVSEASTLLGMGQITWAVLGALIAAFAVDPIARAWGPAGKLCFAAVLCLAALPSANAVFAASGTSAMVMATEGTFCAAMFGSAMLSVIAEITPARVRGLSVSLYAFFMTLVGASSGPVVVAFLTEHVFASRAAVGTSMAITGSAAFLLATGLGGFAALQLRTMRASAGVLSPAPVAA